MVSKQISLNFGLVIAAMMVFTSSLAQVDRVFLQNGSLVKGTVISVADQFIEIEVGEGKVELLKVDIEYINLNKKSLLSRQEISALKLSAKPFFKKGLSYGLSTGLLVGQGEFSDSNAGRWTAQGTVIYKFLPVLQVGISVGYDQSFRFNAAPVSLYYQADIAKKPGGLFAYGSVGMAKMWANGDTGFQFDNVKGRNVYQLGLGNAWKVGNIELIATMGWKRQDVESSNENFNGWGGTQYIVTRTMNRIEIKFGIIF